MILAGCQSADPKSVDTSLPADFIDFYERFHADSAFQMEHIIWPLEGIPDNAGQRIIDRSFRWNRENWRIMKPMDFQQSGYRQSFLPLSDGLIIEKIEHHDGAFALIRRFAIISGEWHLIYYAGLNPVRN